MRALDIVGALPRPLLGFFRPLPERTPSETPQGHFQYLVLCHSSMGKQAATSRRIGPAKVSEKGGRVILQCALVDSGGGTHSANLTTSLAESDDLTEGTELISDQAFQPKKLSLFAGAIKAHNNNIGFSIYRF